MEEDGDLAAVRDSDATVWLEPPPELVSSARSAAEKIFAAAVKYVPKNPLKALLTQGFDAEQIWQQIEIQDRSLLAAVKRQLKQVQKVGEGDLFGLGQVVKPTKKQSRKNAEEPDDEDMDEEEIEEDADEDEEGSSMSDGEEEDGNEGILEDKFLKMKDMESFLEDAEEKYAQRGDEKDEDEMDDDDDDAGDDPLDEEESDDDIRYDDFFLKQKQKPKKATVTEVAEEQEDKSEEEFDEAEKEEDDEEDDEEGDEQDVEEKEEEKEGEKKPEVKSTFEKQAEKTRKRIEVLEKANMDPKHWTMLGEVTAKKRPKNSALEADLDFEHNVRPAPVITEEVTASIEDIIRRRIIEGQFDDVKRKEKLPEAPLAKKKDIDESKSTKGLGELYEEDYMQTAGLAAVPTTEADQLKKEASMLFKKLCTKLDALSHFHFAPKPVIEEMEVKDDVPALAMEEVAPVFVSDASMLAPEELFTGKGAIKDEKELTRNERKSRRAAKKRKFKAKENGNEQNKKPRTSENSAAFAAPPKKEKSAFVKSGKVFAELDRQKSEGPVKSVQKAENAASFKL